LRECAACRGDAARTIGAAMPSYRYCFLDSAGRIAEFHVIAGRTDGEAQTRADRLLAASNHPDIEVWDHGRHVYRARKREP